MCACTSSHVLSEEGAWRFGEDGTCQQEIGRKVIMLIYVSTFNGAGNEQERLIKRPEVST